MSASAPDHVVTDDRARLTLLKREHLIATDAGTPEPGMTRPLMRPGKNTSSPLSRSVRVDVLVVRVAPRRMVFAMLDLTIWRSSAVT